MDKAQRSWDVGEMNSWENRTVTVDTTEKSHFNTRQLPSDFAKS